jgi:acyl carrier protein
MDPADLDPEQTFQTLGVDSILSVEFVALVNARFGTDMKATELYDHPTPSAFARQVAARATGGQPTAPAPVAQTPAPASVAQNPASTPVAQNPASTPVAQNPAPVPVAQNPAPVPVAQTPAPARADGDRAAAVLQTLREQLAETLYCEVWDIDVHATFNTLGLDSILGVEFVAFLNNAYGLDEKAGVLYDHPSLTALAAHVAARTAAAAPAAEAPAAPAAGQISAADLEALLGAVRGSRLTVEQALALLPQHS